MEQIEQVEIADQTPKKVKKTADKKAYIREYKRKEYQENKEEMRDKGRAYYYKYKFNASNEDHTKYATYLPNVIKIRNELEYLKEHKPEFIKEILHPYI